MLKKIAIVLVTLSVVAAADAKTWRSETYKYDAAPLTVLEIDHPVGELEITPGQGETIEVLMRIECSSWRNKCGEKTADIELVGSQSGSSLELKVEGLPKTVNSLSIDLEITIPARLSLDVERGVGETTIRGIEGDIFVETGVGEVNVTAPARGVGRVTAECGVGDADLDVPDGSIRKDGFLFLGNELKWEGTGSSLIEVEVGVGSAEIDLE